MTSVRARTKIGRSACVALALLGATCGGGRPLDRALVTPTETAKLDPARSPILKAHLKDGRVCVLSQWTVNESTRVVSGNGRMLGVDRDGTGTEEEWVRLPIDDVALFETNAKPTVGGAIVPLTVITGASVAVTIACLANPKACFGSCPTFYVTDGVRPVLQAEGFSDSIAPALEDTDVDALYRARPASRALRVHMTNEALETHVVKRVELLAAPRPAGGRVFYAAGESGHEGAGEGIGEGIGEGGHGTFYGATALRAAARCEAPEGPCTDALATFDGRERTSTTDGTNLAAREELTLTFPPSPAASSPTAPTSLGLVIASRQTLLTTFLLYQALAYLGDDATTALAAIDRDPAWKGAVQSARRALGGIEVLVSDGHGGWRLVGEAFETGPIATDTDLVRLPPLPPGETRVRLRLTKGNWRLDWVALADLTAPIAPTRLTARVVTGRTRDGHIATPAPGAAIVTLPGDAYDFDFELPAQPETQELFLSSRGYYLEWMREEWRGEQSRARAAMMLYAPSLALRVLAPAYKKQEAGMERLFWESRFARP